MSKIQIPEHLSIVDLGILKVLSEPVRLEIMKHIREANKRGERCTVKQVAKRMGVPPSRLYYHVKLLEEHDLLVVGDTRMVSGIMEKHYQVAALDITLSPTALSTHSGPKDLALEEILNSISQIVNNSISNARASLIAKYEEERTAKEGGPPAGQQVTLHILKSDMLLTFEQAEILKTRLAELTDEFEQLSDQNLETIEEEMLFFEFTQLFVPQYQRQTNPDAAG